MKFFLKIIQRERVSNIFIIYLKNNFDFMIISSLYFFKICILFN